MAYNHKTTRVLYEKLLDLYPQEFKEQLGESMEQSFNDLCKKRQKEGGKESFPFPLFGFLWFFSMLIVLSGMVILRNVRNLRREGNKRLANLVFLLLGAVLLVNIAWWWGSWIIDQMPCFLGVPLCD